jgi:hypothetical protein
MATGYRVTIPKVQTINPWVDLRAFLPAGTSGPGTAYSDSTAIANALAYISDGDILYIPDGRWNFSTIDSSTAVITKNIRVVGNGNGSTIYMSTGPDVTTTIKVRDCDNVSFENLRFVGCYKTLTFQATLSDTMDNVTFRDVTFDSIHHSCVSMVSASRAYYIRNLKISGCTVINSACGFMFDCNILNGLVFGNTVRHLQEDSNAMYGFLLGRGDYYTSSSMLVTCNVIDGIEATADNNQEVHGILVNGVQAEISNNIIRNIIHVDTTGHSEGIYAKGNRINICNNVLYNGGMSEASIIIKGTTNAYQSSIENNIVIKDDEPHGASIKALSDVRIANNYIVSTATGLYQYDCIGIYTQVQTTKTVVENNHVETTGIGIRAGAISSGIGELIIRGNYIKTKNHCVKTDVGSNPSRIFIVDNPMIDSDSLSALNLLLPGNNTVIKNNFFDMDLLYTTGVYGIYLGDCGNVDFSNNIVDIDSCGTSPYLITFYRPDVLNFDNNTIYYAGVASRVIYVKQSGTTVDYIGFGNNRFVIESDLVSIPTNIIYVEDSVTTVDFYDNVFTNLSADTVLNPVYFHDCFGVGVFDGNKFGRRFNYGMVFNHFGNFIDTLVVIGNTFMGITGGGMLASASGDTTYSDIHGICKWDTTMGNVGFTNGY